MIPTSKVQAFPVIPRLLTVEHLSKGSAKKTERSCPNCAVDFSRSFTRDSGRCGSKLIEWKNDSNFKSASILIKTKCKEDSSLAQSLRCIVGEFGSITLSDERSDQKRTDLSEEAMFYGGRCSVSCISLGMQYPAQSVYKVFRQALQPTLVGIIDWN
ncbi:conserved hypothetical protein [Trichinella spiralis]|uniref:hypothetical protein n=1 Tax=Trichinella spiralis TaxID=6334 RepID=UPI0001EFC3AE|nr:conserved hypothetical protein [Trichinella spiralis]